MLNGMFRRIARICTVFCLTPVLSACLGVPDGIQPVDDFKLKDYLGTWYEIARLDHRFEKGLDHVSAVYSIREDGGINVSNMGYSQTKNTWKEAEGRAYFVSDENIGHLKVSFFGPFYGSYVVFQQDPEKYAYVCGPNRSYLWLLARQPIVPEALIERFIDRAEELGFNTDKLIMVNQKQNLK